MSTQKFSLMLGLGLGLVPLAGLCQNAAVQGTIADATIMTAPGGISNLVLRPYATIQAKEILVCLWHETRRGTPFGASGICDAVDIAVVGDPCGCLQPSGDHSFYGKVIVNPIGDGSTQVVR